MKYLGLFFPILLVILLASCNHGSETSLNGNGAGIWTIPNVGTEYVFSLNASTATPTFDTIEISETGQQIGGKSNVIRILGILSGGQPHSAGFYAIESNGDISIGDSGIAVPDSITWERYPTGGHQTISDTPIVTTFLGEVQTERDVRNFIDSETITTTAGIFSSLHIREITTTISTDSLDEIGDSTIETDDYWFAPSIGFYVKSTYIETSEGQTVSQGEEDLIKFIPH